MLNLFRPFTFFRSKGMFALVFVFGQIPAIAAPPGKAGVFPDETLDVGGAERHFRLIVPKTVDLDEPAPLVVAFHGMGIDSKDVMPRYSKLDELAAAKKFVLVFPDAIGRSWGLVPDKVQADLKFFDALVAEIGKRYMTDETRIYVLGMSNGGYFAHLVGKERSETVAAVCSHSGPLGLQTALGIRAKRKFSVLIVHGGGDRLFPVSVARENPNVNDSAQSMWELTRPSGTGRLL